MFHVVPLINILYLIMVAVVFHTFIAGWMVLLFYLANELYLRIFAKYNARQRLHLTV